MPKQVGSVQCMSAITFGMLLVTFAEILAPPPGGTGAAWETFASKPHPNKPGLRVGFKLFFI
jgi:hypothetical protein